MASSKRTDKERQANKQRSLRLIKSLDPDDDERTTISKKISWILRQGAKVAGVPQDADRWVLVSDLLNAEILAGLDLNVLNKVIVDSNSRKLRYELQETASGTMIRAYTKEERKEREAASGVLGVKPDKYSGDGQLRDSAAAYVPPPASSQAAPQGMVAAAAAAAAMPWPQTSYPMSPTGADMGWPGMGFNPMMMHFMNPWMNWQQQAAAQAAQQQPGKFAGRIKSFNAEKGFGFIECAHTYAQYNRDVFLHKAILAQIGDMPVGAFVTFTCEVNKQGMPQAKEVAQIGAPPQAPAGAGGAVGKGGKGGEGGGKGKSKGKDGGKGGDGKGGKGKDKDGKGKGKDKDGKGGKSKGEKGEKGKGKGKKEKGEKKEGEDTAGEEKDTAEEGKAEGEEGANAEEKAEAKAEEGAKAEEKAEAKAEEGSKAEEKTEGKAEEAKAEEGKAEEKAAEASS